MWATRQLTARPTARPAPHRRRLSWSQVISFTAGMGLAIAMTCSAAADERVPVNDSSPSDRAVSAPAPTEADVARASRVRPVITDADMQRASRRSAMPSDAELARVPIPGPVHVDALPKALGTVDLSDVARGYEALGSAPGAGLNIQGPTLMVFISFAMPRSTLDRLVSQAQAVGATLVLRGLIDGSLRDTVLRSQALIGQHRVSVQIDPQAFDRFAVKHTPTFVLVRSGAAALSCAMASCMDASGYVSIQGDVSLDHALRDIAARDARFALDARTLLRRMSRSAP